MNYIRYGQRIYDFYQSLLTCTYIHIYQHAWLRISRFPLFTLKHRPFCDVTCLLCLLFTFILQLPNRDVSDIYAIFNHSKIYNRENIIFLLVYINRKKKFISWDKNKVSLLPLYESDNANDMDILEWSIFIKYPEHPLPVHNNTIGCPSRDRSHLFAALYPRSTVSTFAVATPLLNTLLRRGVVNIYYCWLWWRVAVRPHSGKRPNRIMSNFAKVIAYCAL